MSVLGAVTRVLARRPKCWQPVEPPAPGAAGDAVAAVSRNLRESCQLEVREAAEAWLEAVVRHDELETCCRALEAAFGPPAKPFGAKVRFDRALQAQIDSRGGIQKNQALYLRRHGDHRVAFAALWPWSDGRRVTLKLGVYA
jgi:hypothetical protein